MCHIADTCRWCVLLRKWLQDYKFSHCFLDCLSSGERVGRCVWGICYILSQKSSSPVYTCRRTFGKNGVKSQWRRRSRVQVVWPKWTSPILVHRTEKVVVDTSFHTIGQMTVPEGWLQLECDVIQSTVYSRICFEIIFWVSLEINNVRIGHWSVYSSFHFGWG